MKYQKQRWSPRAVLRLSGLAVLGAAAFAGCSIGDITTGASSTEPSGNSFSVVVSGSADGSASSGPGGISSGVGAECSTDKDCGPLLSCLGAASNDPIFGGGPAGGFCTKPCDKDDDCPGASTACIKNGNVESGRCTITCTIGPPLVSYDQALDPGKCRGREDLRCDTLKGIGAVCLPTCGSDAQCGPGRVCDPRLAVCVMDPNVGLPTGAKCDPNAAPTTCAGRCVSFDPGVSTCSSPCVLGGVTLKPLDCGGPTQGLCSFGPPENGAGDVGYCTPSCVAHSDCQNPDFWCFTVPEFTALYKVGYCFAARPCKAQSDCNQGQKGPYLCTSTGSGSYCLDPAFPLQQPVGVDAGPGDGGANG